MAKHYNIDTKQFEENEQIDAFLKELRQLCAKHYISISMEDMAGTFVLCRHNLHLMEWLEEAKFCMYQFKRRPMLSHTFKVGDKVAVNSEGMFLGCTAIITECREMDPMQPRRVLYMVEFLDGDYPGDVNCYSEDQLELVK